MAIDKQMHGIVTCLNTLLEDDAPQQRVMRYETFISDTSSDADDALTSIEEWAENILTEHGHPLGYHQVLKLIDKERQYSVVWYAMNCLIRAHDVRTSIRHGDAASAAALSLELMGAVWQANERKLQDEVSRRRQQRAKKLHDAEREAATDNSAQDKQTESRIESQHVLRESSCGETPVQEKVSNRHASDTSTSSRKSAASVTDHSTDSGNADKNTPVISYPESSGGDMQKHGIGLTSAAIKEKVQSFFQIVKPAQKSEDDTDEEADFTDTIMEVLETGSVEDTEFTRKYYQQVVNQVQIEYPKYDLDAVRQLAANRLEISKQYLINLDIRPI